MRKAVTAAALLLMLLTGCQKLNVTSTIKDVRPLEVRRLDFDPPAYSQAVRATIEPKECSVSAYLVRASDADAVEKALDGRREPDPKLVLAGKTFKPKDSRQDILLEATVPPRTAYVLMVHGGMKTTDVKIRVVGK